MASARPCQELWQRVQGERFFADKFTIEALTPPAIACYEPLYR